jgi:cell division protein FtsA
VTHLVGIDIGSHKVTTLVGEALPAGGLRIIGTGHAPAAGMRRGEVTHVEEAAGAIAASVERAERVSGHNIHAGIIGITGLHLHGHNQSAVVACGRQPREIRPHDVDRALEAAGAVPLPLGREVLHILPQSYRLDSGATVLSPIGMEGYRLEADVHLVSASSANLGNLRRCLELAEVSADRLTMSTLAAAEAVLTDDERELGVLLIDLGAASTGVACYRDGSLVHSAVVPLGGRHLTNDLAVVFQTPLAQAERIKISHGHVLPELDEDPAAEVDVQPFGEGEGRKVARRQISEVLAARADEIAGLLMAEMDAAGLSGRLPAGAVLVGGGTELAGMPRRLSMQLGQPVRVGRPTDVVGLAEAARGPDHAGAVGLLLWSIRQVQDAANGLAVTEETDVDTVGRLTAWFKAAFLPERAARG